MDEVKEEEEIEGRQEGGGGEISPQCSILGSDTDIHLFLVVQKCIAYTTAATFMHQRHSTIQ
jgi:hypothetical protein